MKLCDLVLQKYFDIKNSHLVDFVDSWRIEKISEDYESMLKNCTIAYHKRCPSNYCKEKASYYGIKEKN